MLVRKKLTGYSCLVVSYRQVQGKREGVKIRSIFTIHLYLQQKNACERNANRRKHFFRHKKNCTLHTPNKTHIYLHLFVMRTDDREF